MIDDALDNVLMELIVNSGDARSSAFEAVALARKGDFAGAEAKMKAAEDAITKAHNYQTQLMVREADGTGLTVSMIVVHSQDHLMNALTVIDMAKEIILLWKDRFEKSE